jgi:predicted Zn finger-like uncharacterized protein
MLTRCPECATRFRVHEQQLQIAEGTVRCGRCGCVFGARMYSIQALAPPGYAPFGDGVLVMESQPQPGSDALTDATEAITVPISPTRSRSRHWQRALGGAVVLLLLLALGLQGLWWQRHALAAHPEGLQLVRLLCRITPCRPRPPKALEHIEVMQRGLEPHPDRPGVLRFHLRMVNRAPLAQPYPLVELRLLDGLQRLAGVRRFTPAQYLTADGDGLLAPDTPTDVDLELISPGEHVGGFQLDFL